MPKELGRHFFIGRINQCDLDRDLEHIEAIKRHPGGPVNLLQSCITRDSAASVKNPDIIKT